MILRPVTPESPCGPPITNLPVGLMWYVTEPLTSSWGRTGSMTCSLIVLTISACETFGSCCVETTTVSTRTGVKPSYSMVTWLLASGRSQGIVPSFRKLGDPIDDPVCQGDRQRHQLGGVVAGEAEHHPLVAGADVLAPLGVFVDAHGDVRRLLAQGDHDGAGRGVEAHVAGRVADLAHDLADDRRVVDHAPWS